MAEIPVCGECHIAPAIVEDLDVQPARPWCLDCAMVLVKLGDPILSYRELAGGAMYTLALAGRGPTETIPFG